uniref:Uncharacterized protein n=1 Tax=Arundo donax TaxID=35708 RepID=A0A0A9FAQ5_ARUDO
MKPEISLRLIEKQHFPQKNLTRYCKHQLITCKSHQHFFISRFPR